MKTKVVVRKYFIDLRIFAAYQVRHLYRAAKDKQKRLEN